MNPRTLQPALYVTVVLALAGCSSPPGPRDVVPAGTSQLALRSVQTRAFETTDRKQVLRAVIATLQDLGFLIEDANTALGTVSAQKFAMETSVVYRLKMTVTVRPRDSRQMLVRANAEFNLKPVEDPALYQQFFVALGKSLFMEAQQVE